MTEAANRHRGEVPLPEAGEGAFLRFTVDALERLETKFGDDYLDVVVKGLSKVNIRIYQMVITVALQNSNNADVPFGLSFEELEARILDALYMTIHGRGYLEQKAIELDRMQQRLEDMSDANPQLATLLSSPQFLKQDTGQA